jgi:integrase
MGGKKLTGKRVAGLKRPKGPFTAKQVAALKDPGRYLDGHGLYLQVLSPTNRSWLLRYELNKRERWMGLGPLRLFGLKEARDKAREAQRKLWEGDDPIDHNRRVKAQLASDQDRTKTFAECAEAFLAKHSDGWKNAKHRWQWKSSLKTYANPVIGNLFVADIDTPHIVKVLERDGLWTTKHETARRVLGRIERVLNFAKASGYRAGDNPARWSGHLCDLLPSNGKAVEHLAALPYVDLPQFLADLRKRDGIAARALEFTILTAARTGETIGATWSEINLREKTWTISERRMKAGKEHKVPLADRALEVLKSLPREDGNPHVFIGPKAGEGLSNMAMTSTLRRMERSDITVHGFRSCFMDWAHDRTAFPKVVIDMALAHAVGDKVEAAYRRSDLFEKRKRLMAEWARYCVTKPAVTGAKVVALWSAR